MVHGDNLGAILMQEDFLDPLFGAKMKKEPLTVLGAIINGDVRIFDLETPESGSGDVILKFDYVPDGLTFPDAGYLQRAHDISDRRPGRIIAGYGVSNRHGVSVLLWQVKDIFEITKSQPEGITSYHPLRDQAIADFHAYDMDSALRYLNNGSGIYIATKVFVTKDGLSDAGFRKLKRFDDF